MFAKRVCMSGLTYGRHCIADQEVLWCFVCSLCLLPLILAFLCLFLPPRPCVCFYPACCPCRSNVLICSRHTCWFVFSVGGGGGVICWWYLQVSPNLQFPFWYFWQFILWLLLCFVRCYVALCVSCAFIISCGYDGVFVFFTLVCDLMLTLSNPLVISVFLIPMICPMRPASVVISSPWQFFVFSSS